MKSAKTTRLLRPLSGDPQEEIHVCRVMHVHGALALELEIRNDLRFRRHNFDIALDRLFRAFRLTAGFLDREQAPIPDLGVVRSKALRVTVQEIVEFSGCLFFCGFLAQAAYAPFLAVD